ncbi:hypothetical protein SAHL_15590 [Salinisphaera orenii YIM 95161]|uniref:Uncharacterized protein n=1 Tax=Salinisphaera orenii YIM 95161 TaxID=1051139 RepID=A0A423PGC0_9GAMM|nr:hypothetical protein SAHL_15590 [Salinisphaera halophila YIM 95161]
MNDMAMTARHSAPHPPRASRTADGVRAGYFYGYWFSR